MEKYIENSTNTIWLIIIISVIIILFFIYVLWCIIKSAVQEGVKDAIKETLIDTGIVSQLKHTEETKSENDNTE